MKTAEGTVVAGQNKNAQIPREKPEQSALSLRGRRESREKARLLRAEKRKAARKTREENRRKIAAERAEQRRKIAREREEKRRGFFFRPLFTEG